MSPEKSNGETPDLRAAATELLKVYKAIVQVWRAYQQEFNGVSRHIPPQFPWNAQFKSLRAALDAPDPVAPSSATCTGISARWCPVCGDCTCPVDEYGCRRAMDDPRCPLHAPTSPHGEGPAPDPGDFEADLARRLDPAALEEAVRGLPLHRGSVTAHPAAIGAALAEREACARLCETYRQHYLIAAATGVRPGVDPLTACAAAIRARGEVSNG